MFVMIKKPQYLDKSYSIFICGIEAGVSYWLYAIYKFVLLNDVQSNMQAAAIPNMINSHGN